MEPRKLTSTGPDIGTTSPAGAIPEDRALANREEASRKYVYRPPGQTPDLKEHPDWTSRWVRFRIKNTDDPKNIGTQRRDGYEPVAFERRAEVLVNPDCVYPSQSGNIEIGDVMLCRRARYKSQARKAHYQEVTSQQIRGVKNQVKNSEHERYPGTISDDSTFSVQQAKQKQVEFRE